MRNKFQEQQANWQSMTAIYKTHTGAPGSAHNDSCHITAQCLFQISGCHCILLYPTQDMEMEAGRSRV